MSGCIQGHKSKNKKHAEEVKLYQKATAWYDALEVLNVEDRDANPMIEELMEMESAYQIKKCASCNAQGFHEVYQNHLNFCGMDDEIFYDCYWCDLVRHCWDCQHNNYKWSGVEYCTEHRRVAHTVRLNRQGPCTCRSERDYSDEHFMEKVRKYTPFLANLGWQFIWTTNNKLQIIPPSERTDQLTWSEELACQYFGE